MTSGDRFAVAHVQPMTLELFGHRDDDWGRDVRYAVPNIALAQAQAGDRPVVHMLTADRSHTLEVDGVAVRFHRCLQPPRRLSVQVRYARQASLAMLRSIAWQRPQVVHFHGARSLHLMYALVAAAAERHGLPLVGHDHGKRSVGRTEGALLRAGVRRSSQLIAANEESLGFFAGHGVPEDRMHLVPNGIDTQTFWPDPARRAPATPFHVLVVSRLAEEKDPVTAARAVATLARTHPTRLTVIGEGPLRAEVERELRSGDVDVTWEARLPLDAFADRYRGADALVLSSLSEGSNQAVVEAMACGLPVVASDIPGIRESVRGVGRLVPVQRPDRIAEELGELAGAPERWREQRERGLARARELHWDVIVDRLREVYRRAAADPAR